LIAFPVVRNRKAQSYIDIERLHKTSLSYIGVNISAPEGYADPISVVVPVVMFLMSHSVRYHEHGTNGILTMTNGVDPVSPVTDIP
jgi:hypothetical protein